MSNLDQHYMQEALKEAKKAFASDEVPVGAVMVHKGRIIGRAHNQIKLLKDPTAHAEMIAITQAAAFLENERLTDTTMYVTIEPCPMCAGALVLGRVKRLVYGAEDPKSGACGSAADITNNKKLNHRLGVARGIMGNECAGLLKDFFKKKRLKGVLAAALFLFLLFGGAHARADGLDTLIDVGKSQKEMAGHLQWETETYESVKRAAADGKIEKGQTKEEILKRYDEPVIITRDSADKREGWCYKPAASSFFKGERIYLFFDDNGVLDEIKVVEESSK